MKTCSKCKIKKELSEFYNQNNRKSTKQSHCKLCDKLKSQKYYNENKSKRAKYQIEYRKNNKEKRNSIVF